MNNVLFALLMLFGTAANVSAEGFDEDTFLQELNAALEGTGVTVEVYGGGDPQWWKMDVSKLTDSNFTFGLPEYGIGAFDEKGELIQVFGPSVTTVTNEKGEIVGIPGFAASPNTKYNLIGGDVYKQAITKAGYDVSLDGGVQKAVDAISAATVYIGQKLCSSQARPSEITLNLSADFKLVFGASTGTSAKWIMSETCNE